MIKIRLFAVGKTKEAWLEEALSEYLKRMSGYISFESIWLKDDQELIQKTSNLQNLIALDPLGREMDSLQFAAFLEKEIEKNGSRLNLVIGGPLGLPPCIKEKALLMSLSKLTFTHQLARLVLLEQIYRASTLWRGEPYHK